jgi:hypothetical protein
MARSISIGQIAEMKVCVDDYVERRRLLFPEVPLRPKHHFLTHYPQLTLQFGPLINLWTMRFESKHQFFKRCIRSSRNFLNVASMLANRHQLLQAYLSASARFACETDVSPRDLVVESSIVAELKSALSAAGVRAEQVFSAATIKGTTYRRGQVLPLRADYSTKRIVFGEIFLVVLQNLTSKFVIGCRNSVLDYDTGCYLLEERHDVLVVPLECFADFYPLVIYNIRGQSTVVLRHQLVDRY